MPKRCADNGALTGFLAPLVRLPCAIRLSLYPKTDAEAHVVERQLDMARTSQKLFDYTLPLAGGVIFFLDQFHNSTVLGIW